MNHVETTQEHQIDPKVDKFVENFSKTKLMFSRKTLEKTQKMLEKMQFPTTKNERWKYTRTNKITRLNLVEKKYSLNFDASKLNFPLKNVPTIVFINGYFYEPLSKIKQLPNGLSILPLSHTELSRKWIGKIAHTDKDIFATINTLYAKDGAFILARKNTVAHTPIQIVNILSGQNSVATTRNVIVCEESAQVEINQVFFTVNANGSMTNHVTECFVDKNAKLNLNKIQNEQDEFNFHLNAEYVKQQNDSTYTSNMLTLTGDFVRNDIWVSVEGKNAQTHLNGIYQPKNKQHVDNHVSVEHKVANCESKQLYKGIVDQQASAVFNGRVVVEQQAQKINAYQSNANILLSDEASVNSKPELEIFADDVKCSHGTTIGQIDRQAIYYLQTRGISPEKAQYLLVNAFVQEVFDKVENKEVQEYVKQLFLNQQEFNDN